MGADAPAPLAGVRVVEVARGVSTVGAGLATSLPGALLRDFGAEVIRVESDSPPSLDAGVEWARSWDRGKQIIRVDDQQCARTVAGLAGDTDILLLVGDEALVEHEGLGYPDLSRSNPRLVVGRIRPSYDARGPIPDLELLVAARTGLVTELRGHRPGPVFADLAVASAGAALGATTGALACLYEREATGTGGWVETSLYDGLLAILPMIMGRVERPTPALASAWGTLGPQIALSFRCADGGYVQLWFGAKGAYEAFLQHIGDPPSEAGYRADTISGAIGGWRSERWADMFATKDRDWWVEHLAGHNFRCEPVLRPGEELRDPHLRDIGLTVDLDDPDRGTITVLGPVGRVAPVPQAAAAPVRSNGGPSPRLLSDVRVLDLSAYLAGPVTPLILAELGADVVKVEPATGDAHRNVENMFAAGQRGKRAVAVDLKAPGAAEVLQRLFHWSDVVHHNARVGLSERLGYDEETVRRANPHVVYCHASGFGSSGRRALLPANDHLMQALSGVEAAAGGDGQPPTYLGWGAIDVTSGWVAACGVLVGLYARRRTGIAQSVTTSLLGAALMLKSGAFLSRDTVVEGPMLDAEQSGYGAAYRIYQARDGAWLALAVPDDSAWARLRVVVPDLPVQPPPLRTGHGERQPAEELLERTFASNDAATWVALLAAAGVPSELVIERDRDAFNRDIFDDPVNRQLGRVVSFAWGPFGRLDQAAFPVRLGPQRRPAAPALIPDLGQHTDDVLEAVGFDAGARAAFARAGVTASPAPAFS